MNELFWDNNIYKWRGGIFSFVKGLTIIRGRGIDNIIMSEEQNLKSSYDQI